jgi:arginyl-tRNA synthetase
VSDVVAIKDQVEAAVQAALSQVLPAELAGTDPVVRRSDRADFQANGTLAVAKKAVRSPRDIGADVAEHLTGLTAEVSGPGFLNITVPDDVVWSAVAARLADSRRVLTHLGATVTRQNHIGDWGTQFGMLIQYLDEHPDVSWKGRGAETMSALDRLYKAARAEFEADPAFADRARARVVALQAGDAATLDVWRDLVAESEKAFEVIYDRLGILLDGDDFDGESRYNDALPGVVEELLRTGIATESDGAVVTFTDGVTGPEGEPVPLIVRKKDGGFGYAATDLATLRLRVDHYQADRILYVVDARQALHFRMVFDTARRAGWLPDTVQTEHVPFGTVLGTDGRPFKTRSGKTVRLADLLDDAEAAIRTVLEAKEHDFADAELDAVVHAAIKYADLSNTRTKDYVFDVEQMVATTGNTGVYLQYAHARVRSILRKARTEVTPADSVDATLPAHPTEKALALTFDAFGATLRDVADALEPHRLCGYLYDVATAFTRFYDACPVLRANDDAVRANRLALCDLTGRTLATGLDLLGIRAPERM